ncbi:MAG TPA: beta-ketoacyl-ACP synthase III [Actinospica sp.]|nr:beta-ketoacyl-ACP synthase III [Actinospica sp.]
MSAYAVAVGLGSSLPPETVTNHDLSEQLDTSDEWIRTRTGIAARRRADQCTTTADLAVAAGRAALVSADDSPDLVVLATTTPDRRCPATAPEVAHRLGLGHVPAFDLSAVCSGFVYATGMADAVIRSGLYRSVLVIGAETYSRIIDPEDRDTAVIFGDGAGAVLYRRGDADEPGAVHGVELGSDGSGADLVAIAAGGSRLPNVFPDMPRDLRFFRMTGREVFRLAIRRMTASAEALLAQVGWPAAELDGFIGHQANQRILDAVANRLGIPAERRFGNIGTVGNTAAASIPLALADAAASQAAQPGGRTLLTAFGGGLTWGSIALTWPAARPVELPPHAAARIPSPRPEPLEPAPA